MARSYATVGQMITYAYEQVAQSRAAGATVPQNRRFRALTGSLVEYMMMSPRSRDAFMQVILEESLDLGNVVASASASERRPDLSARILPPDGADDDGARLLIALGIGGPVPSARVERLVQRLGDSPRSRLLLIQRKADSAAREDSETVDDHRVRSSTWEKMRGKLAKEDSAHADLWRTIGDIGLTAGLPVVQLPVHPFRLLNSPEIATEFRAHLDVFHAACRAALGVTPRFSTRADQPYPLLQAGDSRGRWGLRFAEVFNGSPTIVIRNGRVLHPLGVALPDDAQDHAAWEKLRADLRAQRGNRTGTPPKHRPMIGVPANPEIEPVRRLLWSVMNPVLLAEHGFVLAPAKHQPLLTATTLALRLERPEDPDGITYTITVGGQREWSSLVPRVQREASAQLPAEEYAVAPRRGWSSSEFVWEVHRALYSLTVPVRRLHRAKRAAARTADQGHTHSRAGE